MRTIFFLFLLWPSACFAQALQQSEELYKEEMSKAKQTLLNVYIDQITKKVAKGDSSGAAQLSEWKTLFETRNVLGGYEDAFASKYREYGASIKKASDDLRNAYVKEIEQLKLANNNDEVSALLTELTDKRLPGELISLQQFRAKGYLKHFALDVYGGDVKDYSEKLNATFELTAGLSDSVHTSIRSLNWPDSYVDHYSFRIKLTASRDDFAWKQHASWIRKPGLADEKNGESFESVSHPGRYLRIRPNGQAWLDTFEENPTFRTGATFYVRRPLFKIW